MEDETVRKEGVENAKVTDKGNKAATARLESYGLAVESERIAHGGCEDETVCLQIVAEDSETLLSSQSNDGDRAESHDDTNHAMPEHDHARVQEAKRADHNAVDSESPGANENQQIAKRKLRAGVTHHLLFSFNSARYVDLIIALRGKRDGEHHAEADDHRAHLRPKDRLLIASASQDTNPESACLEKHRLDCKRD